MMRVSDLESKLYPVNQIYSEAINFAAPKTAPKEKNCKKGTPCKGTCINANKVCRTDQDAKGKTKTKALKAAIKGSASAPSAKAPATPLGDSQEAPQKEKRAKGKTSTPKHKTFMSESEATEYTKDSYYKDKVFFHGTSGAGADAITTKGIDISKNTTALYGTGFYMGGGKGAYDIAKGYASDKEGATVLEMKINIKKPKVFATTNEAMKYMNDNGLDPFDPSIDKAEKFTKLLKKQGYDGLELTSSQYFIAFDSNQVAIYSKSKT